MWGVKADVTLGMLCKGLCWRRGRLPAAAKMHFVSSTAVPSLDGRQMRQLLLPPPAPTIQLAWLKSPGRSGSSKASASCAQSLVSGPAAGGGARAKPWERQVRPGGRLLRARVGRRRAGRPRCLAAPSMAALQVEQQWSPGGLAGGAPERGSPATRRRRASTRITLPSTTAERSPQAMEAMAAEV